MRGRPPVPEEDTRSFCSVSSTPEDTERPYDEESLLRSLPSDLGQKTGERRGGEETGERRGEEKREDRREEGKQEGGERRHERGEETGGAQCSESSSILNLQAEQCLRVT